MKKNQLLSLVFFFTLASAFSQNLWNRTSDAKLATSIKSERKSLPNNYLLYSLDIDALKNQLSQAPLDSSGLTSNVKIAFPNPDGVEDTYTIYEAPVMEAGLSAKFPNIKAYIGQGTLDPTATIRFSVTLFGLHAMTFSGHRGTAFIDTYTKDLKNYIFYYKSEAINTSEFTCLVDEKLKDKIEGKFPETNLRASDGIYRVYRLALACTIEYAAYHVNAAGANAQPEAVKKAVVLSAMNVSMVRINGLYEKDMAVRMNIVANNDLIIFITTDSFTNSPQMINEIQPIVDAAIGVNNYDVGHGFCTTNSGIAQLNSPCGSGKARGITGQANPVGDPFDIDYVAHEMGHQFGGNHTQNNGCNRNNGTAVEPGSASTIMGYAGICAPNVQSNSDSHFHGVSISEMSAFVVGGGNCSTNTANGNAAPVISAGLDYTIPNGTPFILKATATDADGDALTYCWEQTNTEVSAQPPTQTATGGPNFRSNPPAASPDRYMPPLVSVINNILNPTWEVVPTVARTMTFALTVRDNETVNGAQTKRDDMVVTTAAVGPFLVNIPNTAVSWVAGTNQTVTWAVAGTTANNINATYVDILLSNDGGNTYPIVLSSKVPNDGSETVTVPNNTGTTKRIMVRGYKHIFYDISNTNFTITGSPIATFSVAFSGIEEQQNKKICQGNTASYNISYLALGGFTGTTSFSATGLPTGATATFAPTTISANGTVVMTFNNTTTSPVGIYNIIVTATSGAATKTAPFYIEMLSNTFPAMALSTPTNNAVNQQTSLTLNWAANSNADSYDVQVATNNAFTTIVRSGTVSTTSFSVTGLNLTTDYFWRVLPKNTLCGNGVFSSPFTFRTGSIACNTIASPNVPIAISASGAPTITSTINVTSGGTISDLDVTTIIAHSYVTDLTVTLAGPGGQTATLFSGQCVGNDNVNATFDDAAAALVCGTNPTISGTVAPATPLSIFNGTNCVGLWTLTVSDDADVDGGSLNGWSLRICSNIPPLNVAENVFQDFSLFPNPNKGNFNVKFTTISNEDIKITIFDVRGREIFKNSYTNTSSFNQNINLENVQAGIYLVSVNDGNKKVIKKIVIE